MKCKNIKYIKCYVILLLFILSLFICSFVVSSYNTSATSISISVSPTSVNIYKGKEEFDSIRKELPDWVNELDKKSGVLGDEGYIYTIDEVRI